jgi:hypothetical protein
MKHLVLSVSLVVFVSGPGVVRSFGEDVVVSETYRDRGPKAAGPVRTAREIPTGAQGSPIWKNPRLFGKDVFTFARLRYSSGKGGGYYGGGEPWKIDAPDSDLNLSYRLQQMTSMMVDPNGRIVDLTDPALSQFPWIYVVEAGALYFTADEAVALRKYLLNGGFLLFDDFWGDAAWRNVEYHMRRVLPGKGFSEVPLEHPLYHCVFEITAKGQVPNSSTATDSEQTGITYEVNHDGDVKTVHHRGIFDDKGRLMVLATHNTDTGEGWESEGENEYFFRMFSERIAYPLGINIIFYVMTH